MLKLWLIKKLLSSLDDQERHEVLTLAVKKLFTTVGDNDILKQKEGKWFYRNVALKESDMKLLTAETHVFLNSYLYKILQTEIEYRANRRMFLESKNEFDLIAGKVMLYILDIIKSVLNRITQSK
jgi:hypothetical protein